MANTLNDLKCNRYQNTSDEYNVVDFKQLTTVLKWKSALTTIAADVLFVIPILLPDTLSVKKSSSKAPPDSGLWILNRIGGTV